MSDWEKRPLSSSQLKYAALDAFVLLQIYDVVSNPNTGLRQAQLQSCLYSHDATGRQPSTRKSHRNRPTDAHPAQQPSSRQQPSDRGSPLLPVVPIVSQPSHPSTTCSQPTVPSSTSAMTFHSQAATERSRAPLVATQRQQGTADQSLFGDASRVSGGLALQECLQSHGLQSALRTHSSLGAG